MNTLSYKTLSKRKEDVERSWFVVDAQGQTLGRMATQIADVLRGKTKPDYTPHVDTGDYVIVINAEKIVMSGNKMKNKEYDSYSGYPGGRKVTTAEKILEKKPTALVEKAVKGMLPKNKLANAVYRKLFVYAGNEHPHEAQKPVTLKTS